MATFIYRLIQPDSQMRWGGGRYPFESSTSLRSFLERSGDTVIFIKAMPGPLEMLCQAWYRVNGRRIPHSNLEEFLRNVSVMLQTGVTFAEAVRESAETTDNKLLDKVSKGVAMAVESGLQVHAAMSRYKDVFPSQILHMIRVGEETAAMDMAFMAAAEHVKRVGRIGVDVRKALIYPVIALVAVVLALAFWLYYTVPAMSDMYIQMGMSLPDITLLMMDIAAWVRGNTSTVLISAAIVFIVLRLLYTSSKRFKFWWQTMVLHLPVLGRVSRNASIAYFSEYFSMLVRSGVNTYKSLEIIADSMDNEAYRRAVLRVHQGVANGNSISSEMARNPLFPGMVCRMVRTGEQTGTLADQMAFVSVEYTSRLHDVIDRVKALVEPAAILIVGALMLLIVFSMFFPVYNLILQMSGSEM
jgi:type II secretory pathway component PulF